MSNLRQVAQQALEALEAALSDDQPYIERCKQTRTALRAALAEDALQRLTDVQQEMEAHDPVDYRGWVLREVLFYNGEPVSHREPEQEPVVDCPRCGHCCPQQQSEPVAWMFQHEETGRINYVSNDGIHTPTMFLERNPRYALVCLLYTAPPQRKPLTDVEIDWMTRGNNYPGTVPGARRFARAIEAHHGIKGEA